MSRWSARLADLKARHPLEAVVGRYLELRRSGAWWLGFCPFHDNTRTPSFAVSATTQTWHCFSARCGLSGDVIDFVGRLRFGPAWNPRQATLLEAVVQELDAGADPSGADPMPLAQPEPPRPPTRELQVALHAALRVYHLTLLRTGDQPGTPLHTLIHERGVPLELIRREGLGYADGRTLLAAAPGLGLTPERLAAAGVLRAADAGRWHESLAGRLIFPDLDPAGNVQHWVGRAWAAWLGADAPKYLSARGLTRTLHGLARVRRLGGPRPVFLVESPPDRYTLLAWGYDALAVCGTRLRADQAAAVCALRRPVVIVPHNDAGAGAAATERWVRQIPDASVLWLPEGVKDVNAWARERGAAVEFARRLAVLGFEAQPIDRNAQLPGVADDGEMVGGCCWS